VDANPGNPVTPAESKAEFLARMVERLGVPTLMTAVLGFALWSFGQSMFDMMRGHLSEVTSVMKTMQDTQARAALIQEKMLWRMDQIEAAVKRQ